MAAPIIGFPFLCFVVALVMDPVSTISVDFDSGITTKYNLNHHKRNYQLNSTHPTYLVLELMPNGTLKSFLQSSPQQSIAGHVVNEMRQLENHNIVHRNLTASNVLVNSDGVCKVASFGLARRVSNNSFTDPHRRCPCPTPWAAPEAISHYSFSVNSDVSILEQKVIKRKDVCNPHRDNTQQTYRTSNVVGSLFTAAFNLLYTWTARGALGVASQSRSNANDGEDESQYVADGAECDDGGYLDETIFNVPQTSHDGVGVGSHTRSNPNNDEEEPNYFTVGGKGADCGHLKRSNPKHKYAAITRNYNGPTNDINIVSLYFTVETKHRDKTERGSEVEDGPQQESPPTTPLPAWPNEHGVSGVRDDESPHQHSGTDPANAEQTGPITQGPTTIHVTHL